MLLSPGTRVEKEIIVVPRVFKQQINHMLGFWPKIRMLLYAKSFSGAIRQPYTPPYKFRVYNLAAVLRIKKGNLALELRTNLA